MAIIGIYAIRATEEAIVTGPIFTAAVWMVAMAVILMAVCAYIPEESHPAILAMAGSSK